MEDDRDRWMEKLNAEAMKSLHSFEGNQVSNLQKTEKVKKW